MEHEEMRAGGVQSLEWLASVNPRRWILRPIGSNGFYRRNERKASFDQQPVEACAMVSACLEAGL